MYILHPCSKGLLLLQQFLWRIKRDSVHSIVYISHLLTTPCSQAHSPAAEKKYTRNYAAGVYQSLYRLEIQSVKHILYTHVKCVWGVVLGSAPQTDKHLPQSLFTGHLFR